MRYKMVVLVLGYALATSTSTNVWPFDAFDMERMQEKMIMLSPLAIYNGRSLMFRYIFDQFIY